MISKELIKQIIDEYDGDDMAGHIAHEIALIESIKNQIRLCNAKKQKSIDGHKAYMADIDREIKLQQERCLHWDQTYHGDPSGGHDSFHECNICGKQS